MQNLRTLGVYIKNTHSLVKRTVSVNIAEKGTSEDLMSWREIPGPPSLPLIGQLHHFLPGGILSNRNDFITDKLYKKYGPIVRINGLFGSPPTVILYDAEASAQILRGENWAPVRPILHALAYYRKEYKKDESLNTSAGLIIEHGEEWKKFRSKVNPVLLQTKIIKMYNDPLSEVAEDMIKRIKLLRNDKNMIESNFDMEMNMWALESIGIVTLGRRLNCFDPDLPEDSPVKKLVTLVHEILDLNDKLEFTPTLWRYIKTPTFKKAMKKYDELMTLNKFFIDKTREELNTKITYLNEEKGVLEKLLEIDENVAEIMSSDMLFTGVDTTSNAAMWTLYFLASHPDKQSKLREEIASKDEKKLYLKACIKESLRLRPIILGNLRKTTKDYSVFGYQIPKGIIVITGQQVLSTMEEQYPRPKEFIPERWIVEKSDPLYHGNAHPFAFSPFGFGVRSCIGRRIAELELEKITEKIIENFNVGWAGPPPAVRVSILNYITQPLHFVFKDV